MSRRSQGVSTVLEAPVSRFSVNSNLMNYSIPHDDAESHIEAKATSYPSEQRAIQSGEDTTRIRQLENQIEAMTLQNVKLLRTNRLLKIDTDNMIKQTTQPLEEKISELTLANVRLQRANKLLQMDLDEKSSELNRFREEEIIKLKSVGPEYEYLVQMINLLHRQINGSPLCEETCCFTAASIDQSTVVMTLPPESDEQKVEAQHICRPVIHSNISQGSYAAELDKKIVELEDVIVDMNKEREEVLRQARYYTADTETLKQELRLKEELVSQLEQEFTSLEELVAHLQQQLDSPDKHSVSSDEEEERVYPHAPVSILKQSRHDSKINHNEDEIEDDPHINHDPRRRSQLLMASKRLSFKTNDTELLEKMLRGDLSVGDEDSGERHHVFDDDHSHDDKSRVNEFKQDVDTSNKKQEEDVVPTDPAHILSNASKKGPKMKNDKIKANEVGDKADDMLASPGRTDLPCIYPDHPTAKKASSAAKTPSGASALFVTMSFLFGIAASLQITDDWTLPITLAVLASRFLWTGSMHELQFKIKMPSSKT
ncbi:hypothetical protein NQZ79_g2676 [Umbelopsis isabellina]|nr:hypothetical protein NQZ79_g2676 [Umbelopsis isabellina]